MPIRFQMTSYFATTNLKSCYIVSACCILRLLVFSSFCKWPSITSCKFTVCIFLFDILSLKLLAFNLFLLSEKAFQQKRLKKHIGGWWLQTIQMPVVAITSHLKLMKQKIWCSGERRAAVLLFNGIGLPLLSLQIISRSSGCGFQKLNAADKPSTLEIIHEWFF